MGDPRGEFIDPRRDPVSVLRRTPLTGRVKGIVVTQNSISEIEQMKKAVQGLTYPSDSDEPFDVFCWDAKDLGSARDEVAAHAGSCRAIEEVPINTFFDQLEGSDDMDRYRQLQRLLKSLLEEVTVFRAGSGEVRVDIYLIGKLRSGQWAGVHTVSVET
jgi:hypothetical protein